jgi:methylenetetrahydrofolate reductase (NADPH)
MSAAEEPRPVAVADNRFEILPMGSGEAAAMVLDHPAVLTVTCSPRHGIDHTVGVAERLQRHGHRAVVHLAARAVRDPEHLDVVLGRLAAAGMDDVFVIGGDASVPEGPYLSAGDLLETIADHPHRPPRIGIGVYPEGHPLIDAARLDDALARKSAHADYMVTQLCFDVPALLGWLEEVRARGIDLPVYVGIPGAVDRRKLLEISMRVGVGASVSFLRKQRGLGRLLGRPSHAADALHRAIDPLIGDPEWGIVGFHYYTFNRLVETWEWEAGRQRAAA